MMPRVSKSHSCCTSGLAKSAKVVIEDVPWEGLPETGPWRVHPNKVSTAVGVPWMVLPVKKFHMESLPMRREIGFSFPS
jgi:hypothetical protein